MNVRELLAILQKLDPETEVVTSDPVNGELYQGVEAVTTEAVHPWGGEAYMAETEEVCVLEPTYESVATHPKTQV